MYQVILPAVFMAVRNGLLRDEDDDGEMERAVDKYDMVMNFMSDNIGAYPVIGDIVEQGVNEVFDKPFDHSASPALTGILDAKSGLIDIGKLLIEGDYTQADMAEAFEALVNVAQPVTGLPIDRAAKTVDAISDLYNGDGSIKSLLGYSDYAVLGEDKANEARKNEARKQGFSDVFNEDEHKELFDLFDKVDTKHKGNFNVTDQKDEISDDDNVYELTDDQLDELNDLTREKIKEYVLNRVSKGSYRRKDDNEKADLIGDEITEARSDAREEFIEKTSFKDSQISPK